MRTKLLLLICLFCLCPGLSKAQDAPEGQDEQHFRAAIQLEPQIASAAPVLYRVLERLPASPVGKHR